MFNHLEHKCCKLEVLYHQYGNLTPLSGILSPTKPPGMSITSQITVMSSSERLARFCGESIPWFVTSFQAMIGLNPSLRNIICISSLMVGGGHSVASIWLPITTVATSSPSFSLLTSLGDYSFSSFSLSGPLGDCILVPLVLLSLCHLHVMSF